MNYRRIVTKIISYSLLFCSAFFLNPQLQASEKKEPGTAAYLPGLAQLQTLKLALPEKFIALSLNPQISANLEIGVLWGPREVIESIWAQQGQEKIIVTSGIFRASFTDNVTQTGVDQFSFGTDDDIKFEIASNGVTDVKIKRLYWGRYPVVTLTCMSAKGKPQAFAWVGVNQDRRVLKIAYFFPDGLDIDSYQKDVAIWNRFIEKTAPLTQTH
ncbi:MAG: hypothetical protein JWO53_217 [Chlamydiia bacterium]|nr:hypothetical protein [Chlamydiia bacterium]